MFDSSGATTHCDPHQDRGVNMLAKDEVADLISEAVFRGIQSQSFIVERMLRR